MRVAAGSLVRREALTSAKISVARCWLSHPVKKRVELGNYVVDLVAVA